jgi:hypothetical protein
MAVVAAAVPVIGTAVLATIAAAIMASAVVAPRMTARGVMRVRSSAAGAAVATAAAVPLRKCGRDRASHAGERSNSDDSSDLTIGVHQ